MKKLFSILFAALIILSGMNASIATHICGGKIVASKFSLSGEKASCGMKTSNSEKNTNNYYFNTNCCKDKIFLISVDDDFSPSTILFKEVKDYVQYNFIIPIINLQLKKSIPLFLTDGSPPDVSCTRKIRPADICVFLI